MASNDSDEFSLWESGGAGGTVDESVAVDIDGSLDGGKTHTFTQFPTSAVDEEEGGTEDNDTSQLIEKKSAPVWSFEFYKQLFDVDTYVVLGRIKGSMLPRPSSEYTRNYVGGNPDAYGPFWICATLVMTIAICGNLTTLFNHYNDPDYHYTPEFHRLVIAAIIVYSYTFLIPLLLKGVFFCAKLQSGFGYLDILCLYGYSMFSYIPVSLLLLIPNCVVEWILVAIAVLVSGSVIMVSLWPALREGNKKVGIVLLLCVFALHFAFGLSLRMYFFGSIKCSDTADDALNVTTVTAPFRVTTAKLNITSQ